MTLKSLLAAGLTFAALTLPMTAYAQNASSAPAPAPAANPAPTAAPAADGTPAAATANWKKVCSPLPPPAAANAAAPAAAPAAAAPAPATPAPAGGAAAPAAAAAGNNGKMVCIMQQVVVTQNRQFLGSFLLVNNPQEPSRLMAIVAVPLGVMLPFGVTYQIDNGPAVRLPYMACDPQTCYSQTTVNEDFVNKLKKGTKLIMAAKNRKGDKIDEMDIAINLKGFTDVYEGDAALTPEENTKQTSGQSSLERLLQDRAEAARQARSADGTAPADGASSSQAPAQ